MHQKTGQASEDKAEPKAPGETADAPAPDPAEAPAETVGPPEPDLEAQIAELKDRLLRTMADAENTRRRAEKEKAETHKFAIARFARDLLSVADNLRRAIEAVPDDRRETLDEVTRNLIAGVEMVERELMSVFETHGIRQLAPEPGTKFDPNLHQAMAEVPASGQKPGTVADTYQTGYTIGDRLLRAAMVTVAAAGPPDKQGEKPGDSKRPAAGSAQDQNADKSLPAETEATAGPGTAADTEA